MYDRDGILAAVDLPALADELLGARRGARVPTWPCPSETHAQTGRTPPVTVFTTRRGEQRWTCHGCGESGTAIDLVMAAHHIDVKSALEWLAARTGVTPCRDAASRSRSVRPPRPAVEPPPRPPDPAIDGYVAACESALWSRHGEPARRWLTEVRVLPPDLLRAHRVGFDPGPRHVSRPDGVPRAAGIVLPVLDAGGRAVFTQTRCLDVRGDRPRYLNCAARAAPNPRIALYRPTPPVGTCVVVCEGAIDALSVAATGRRSAAVLGAALADERVARDLVDLGAPLVIAFDADSAGDAGAHRLQGLVHGLGRPAVRLRPPAPAGDLNAWMAASPDWDASLSAALRSCFRAHERAPTLEVAR